MKLSLLSAYEQGLWWHMAMFASWKLSNCIILLSQSILSSNCHPNSNIHLLNYHHHHHHPLIIIIINIITSILTDIIFHMFYHFIIIIIIAFIISSFIICFIISSSSSLPLSSAGFRVKRYITKKNTCTLVL